MVRKGVWECAVGLGRDYRNVQYGQEEGMGMCSKVGKGLQECAVWLGRDYRNVQYGWEEIIGMCSKVAEGAWKRVLVQSYVRTMEGGGGIYK